MSVLDWHSGLNVGVAFMDTDHAHAADLINRLADAADAASRQPLMVEFVEHCREHFSREEALMTETGFFALGCHQGEHERVLAELERVLGKLAQGDAQDGYFRKTLPDWLNIHRGTMDAVTAEFARNAGFVP